MTNLRGAERPFAWCNLSSSPGKNTFGAEDVWELPLLCPGSILV